MASEQDVIIQINDITNRVSTTITTMAGDTRSVADKLAALQGAITSGNQAAVSAAMDNIAPELGKMSAMADQLDTIKTALHTLASDPNNPTAVGVPLSALGSGGDAGTTPPADPAPANPAPAEPASGTSSGGSTADTGTPPAQGSAAPDAAPAPVSGSDAPPDTGAPAAPDLTGPTNTAVGGAADVPTTQAAGMPSGEVPATDPAPGTTGGPTVGAPDTAPGA
jgi:hypothetical protein